MRIDDKTRDLIVLVGHDHFLQELPERHIRERHPRGDHLLGGLGCNPGQPVAGSRRRCLGHEVAQIREDMRMVTDGVAIDHGRIVGYSPEAV
jgi:hypothetical protein